MQFARLLICVLLTAFSVKVMDDYLDMQEDASVTRGNLVCMFGQTIIPYAMLSLCIAAMIDGVTALSLFASAYVVGMVKDQGQIYPSGLTPSLESVGVLLVASGLMGVRPVACSVSVLLLVQIVDDIVDARSDENAGRHNLAREYGLLECTTAAGVICIVAAIMCARLLLACALSVAVTEVSLGLLQRAREHRDCEVLQ